MGEIIGSVRVTPAQPRPWEPVLVEVLGPDGSLVGDDVGVWVSGVPGSRQWTQLPVGPRTLVVQARQDGVEDTETVRVEVVGDPVVHHRADGTTAPARLLAFPNAHRPYLVTFRLSTPAATSRVSLPHPGLVRRREPIESLRSRIEQPRVYEWSFGDGATTTTTVPQADHDYTPGFDHRQVASTFDVSCTISGEGIEPVTVIRTLTIDSWYARCAARGYVVCPVDEAPNLRMPWSTAQGCFVVHNPEDATLTFTRAAIQPLVPDDEDDEVREGPPLVRRQLVRAGQLGAARARIDRSKLLVPLAGDRAEGPTIVELEQPVVVTPHASTVVALHLGVDELPEAAFGYGITLGGTSSDGRPCRASAYFELTARAVSKAPGPELPAEQRRTWPWDEVVHGFERVIRDPEVQVVLPGSSESATVGVDRRLGMVSLQLGSTDATRIVPGLAERLAPVLDQALAPLAPVARDGDFDPEGPPVEGNPCNPFNVSDGDRAAADDAGLACLVSGTEERRVSGRIVNARKGDVVLSPGNGSFMALLYQRMTPPQAHSHALIMTRNYDEVGSSFGSGEWLEAKLKEDIPPDFDHVKVGWPGAVAQHVDNAIVGETFRDPDGLEFEIQTLYPFNKGELFVDGTFRITPALVLKPDPLLETTAVRTLLRTAADSARARCGRVRDDGSTLQSRDHFSFFTFTDGAFSTPADGTGGWPAGTLPSACSTFIWRELRAAGAVFEQAQNDPATLESADLEPADLTVTAVGGGAEVLTGTRDGLYRYRSGERRAAGSALFATVVHDAIKNSVFGLGGLVAAPVANCFLNVMDRNETSTGSEWQQTGEGLTVSPDDMLFWDGPDRGGVLGFIEPLLYRAPRTEVVNTYAWTPAPHKGTVKGRVLFDGEPFAGATVHCGMAQPQISGPDGAFTFTGIHHGPQLVKAHATISGAAASSPDLVLDVDGNEEVTLELRRASRPDIRRLTVALRFFGVDDESGPFESDEIRRHSSSFEMTLGPAGPDATKVVDKDTHPNDLVHPWGGECRAEYRLSATLTPDFGVNVLVSGKLFEGGSEETDTLRVEFADALIAVPRDALSAPRIFHMQAPAGDVARLRIRIRNAEDPVGGG